MTDRRASARPLRAPDGASADARGSAAHWDAVYANAATTRSWYQEHPTPSLDLLDASGIGPADSVVDIGGGASTLADHLLRRGYTDVTVVDVSAAGLRQARSRLGPDAGRITWLVTDVLHWRPDRRYRAWHDRALLHFLTAEPDRDRYLGVLRRASGPGSIAIIGCFAPDGPETCSGLPVRRYGVDDLAAALGPDWELVSDLRQEHHTPAGVLQPFTWAAFRRSAE